MIVKSHISLPYVVLVILSLLAENIYAQKLKGELYYQFFADNREYGYEYSMPQSMLGSRIDLHGGFELNANSSIYTGFNHLIEFGHPFNSHKPVLNMFYRYSDEHFLAYFGSFPRHDLLKYPRIMMDDSVSYYRPNIQGAMGQWRGSWGYQTVWIDWTSRQSQTAREAFITGLTGRIKFGPFYLEDHYHQWHRAGMMNDSIRDIRDNNAFALIPGVNLTEFTLLDSLSISCGALFSSDRIRPADAIWTGGLLAGLTARYKRVQLDLTYYYGDAPSIEFGDNIYKSGNYFRSDFVWIPFESKYVKSRVIMGLHWVNGELNYTQQIYLSAYFNNKTHK